MSDDEIFLTQNTFRENALDESADSMAAFDAVNVIENLSDLALEKLEVPLPNTKHAETDQESAAIFSDISDDELVQTCTAAERLADETERTPVLSTRFREPKSEKEMSDLGKRR